MAKTFYKNNPIDGVKRVIQGELPDMQREGIVASLSPGGSVFVRFTGSSQLKEVERSTNISLNVGDRVLMQRSRHIDRWIIINSYAVAQMNGNSASSPSPTSDTSALTPPSGLVCISMPGNVGVEWLAPGNRSDLLYEISIGTSATDTSPSTYRVAGGYFSIPLGDTTARYFKVRSVDLSWNRSGWSTTVTKAALPTTASDFPAIADLSMGSHKLTNLATPTTTTDAANKAYVDSLGSPFPATADLSMGSHKLINLTDPTSAQDAATKHYADSLAGQTFPPIANIPMGGYKLTGLADPVLAQDAATQAYVLAHASSGGSLAVRPQGGAALTSITTIEFATGTSVTDLSGGAVRVTPPSGGGGSGSTAWVDPYNPDAPPTTANAMDDEFNGSTLDSKWTWYNQNSITYSVSRSRLMLVSPSVTNYGGFIAQPITDSAWTFNCKATLNLRTGYFGIGLFLYNSSSGKFIQMIHFQYNGLDCMDVYRWNNFTAYNGFIGSAHIGISTYYFKIVLLGDLLSFYGSADGQQYGLIGTDSLSGFLGSVTHVGLGMDNQSSGIGNIDWFRRLA